MKRRFTIQFGIIAVSVLILSSGYYHMICEGLRRAKRDAVGKFNYLIHDTTYYNSVFIGSSTMHVDINPLQFDSVTGLYSLNGGMDGMGIAEVHMVVRKFIECHGAPRHLFLNIDELTLTMKSPIWYFPQYYPFIGDRDMNEIIAQEPKLLLGRYFPPAAVIYFDDPLKNLALIGLLRESKETHYDIPLRGFAPKTIRKVDQDFPKSELSFIGSERGWQLLEEIIVLTEQKDISVSILLLPQFNSYLSDSSHLFLTMLNSLEDEYGVKIFNYTTDQRFQSKDLYFDRAHLNEMGAYLLTSVFAKEFSMRK